MMNIPIQCSQNFSGANEGCHEPIAQNRPQTSVSRRSRATLGHPNGPQTARYVSSRHHPLQPTFMVPYF